MIKIVNIKNKQPFDIYIGRENKWLSLKQSIFANPFVLKNESGRDKCLEDYENYVRNNEQILKNLHLLKDKILGCYCHPKKCHGDILIKLYKEFCE